MVNVLEAMLNPSAALVSMRRHLHPSIPVCACAIGPSNGEIIALRETSPSVFACVHVCAWKREHCEFHEIQDIGTVPFNLAMAKFASSLVANSAKPKVPFFARRNVMASAFVTSSFLHSFRIIYSGVPGLIFAIKIFFSSSPSITAFPFLSSLSTPLSPQ